MTKAPTPAKAAPPPGFDLDDRERPGPPQHDTEFDNEVRPLPGLGDTRPATLANEADRQAVLDNMWAFATVVPSGPDRGRILSLHKRRGPAEKAAADSGRLVVNVEKGLPPEGAAHGKGRGRFGGR